MPIKIQNSTFNITRIFVLGLLSAFGPFVMDMYLSGFPEIMEYYRATPAMVQMSLASCTLGLAIGQIVFGAVSDWAGRKAPLLISLAVYLAMSVACVYSPSISIFITARFFQGLAASGGVVISRSIAADTYTGSTLSTMYGIIGMINGVATVLAPMFGGFVVELMGWKGVFWLLIAIGVVMISMGFWFEESLPPAKRIPLNVSAFWNGIKSILRNRLYTGSVSQYALAMAIIFLNLASGPFIMDYYGFDATEISLIIGFNSIALAITSLLAARHPSMLAVMRISNKGTLVGACIVAASLIFNMGFWVYEVGVFFTYLFVGAMLTAVATVSMDAGRSHAGIASAVYGACGFIIGSIVSPITGLPVTLPDFLPAAIHALPSIFITTSLSFLFISILAIILSYANPRLRP